MLKIIIESPKNFCGLQYILFRCFSSSTPIAKEVDNQFDNEFKDKTKTKKAIQKKVLNDLRFKYPDFLPSPVERYRSPLLERLMRKDMLERRSQIHIPEFYVGSILKITISDPHSQGKTNSFVGICTQREYTGLCTQITLRNVIDHQGIDVTYDIYDPLVQKIEVLKLEKRLDDRMLYLRDALPEYSTIDVNMEPELLAEGASAPLNETIVKMKPLPWMQKWERKGLKGIENLDQYLNLWRKQQREKQATPWEKYDLMKEYRKTIPEEEQNKIFSEIFSRINKINEEHKQKAKAIRRTINKPQNIG